MKNLAFHSLWNDYITNSHYLAYVFLFRKAGRMYFFELWSKSVNLPAQVPYKALSRSAWSSIWSAWAQRHATQHAAWQLTIKNCCLHGYIACAASDVQFGHSAGYEYMAMDIKRWPNVYATFRHDIMQLYSPFPSERSHIILKYMSENYLFVADTLSNIQELKHTLNLVTLIPSLFGCFVFFMHTDAALHQYVNVSFPSSKVHSPREYL